MAIGDSGHADHRFRFMAISNSGPCRSPIPVDADQLPDGITVAEDDAG
jgi:hypothetical protein